MKPVVIDYESYYDSEISVVRQGNVNYTRDADAYILAVCVGDEINCGTIEEMRPIVEPLVRDPEVVFWAANSNFDQQWNEKYYGASVNPWRCILDVGAYHQLRRNLAGLSETVLKEKPDKSIRDKMKGVRWESLTEAQQREVMEYCISDVRSTRRLIDALPPMSPTEERIAEHTRMINRRGLRINRALVETDKTLLEELKFNCYRLIPWRNEAKPLSYPALRDWCVFNKIPVPKSTAKTNEDCADLMSDHPILKAVLENLRVYRRANTLLKKVDSLLDRLTVGDILPMDFMYCGAPHTRRWSSRGVNVQNLDKEPWVLPGMDGKAVWSRRWIIPREGHIFYNPDYAQIEPRCLNWIAGNKALLDAIRDGYSYYEAYARDARGWSGAPNTIKEEYGKAKYTLLKNECLGLGYGMGADRFISYAAQSGGIVTPEQAVETVDGFRKRNQKITALWRKLDRLVQNAVRDQDQRIEITMPTGELLKHFSVRSNGSGGYKSYTIKDDFGYESCQYNLWGGVLTENVTQRMARDVIAESVLRLEDAGIPVVFHAHDEAILEIPLDGKEETKIEADKIMRTSPEWAPDLPLDVGGDFADSFTK